jgi:3',5'-cyclic AMP phosphodiesterase CpdA
MPGTACDVRWLHLSDFHFRSEKSYDRDVVLRALMTSLPGLLQRAGRPNLIFVSGDIAYSGKKTEYDEATKFFDHLLSEVGLTKRELIVVPGNHDVDRSGGKGLVRTLKSREESDDYFDPSKPLPHVSERQAAFAAWYNDYFAGLRFFSEESTCGKPAILTFGKLRLAVLPINSAVFSLDDDDYGKLWIGRRCVHAGAALLTKAEADLKIAVMHHPFSWLNTVEAPNIRAAIRSAADCVLSGHLHETDVEEVAGVFGRTIHLAAGATYQTRDWPNTAMFVSVSGDRLSVLPIRYEDSPREIWTVDTSVFPDSMDYYGEVSLPRRRPDRLVQVDRDSEAVDAASQSAPPVAVHIPEAVHGNVPSTQSSQLQAAKAEFEQDLFVTPSGVLLYAQPRLMTRPPELDFQNDDTAEQIDLETILTSSASYIIETKAEFGGSSLCKRLAHDFIAGGKTAVYRRDARSLPNYRKKLESVFPPEVMVSGTDSVLILDNVDLDRDEKLLREIAGTGWFSRLIIVSVHRGPHPVKGVDPSTLPYKFEYLYLSNIGRSDVRSLAATLFQSSDPVFVSSIVDKVYTDLLELCIPLTPANVIMYLRILFREGEFHPLNRVDIVGRYLQEMLRRPSDVYRDTFNSKSPFENCLNG